MRYVPHVNGFLRCVHQKCPKEFEGLRAFFGTHSLRRPKTILIYRRTGNLRALLLLLGHAKIESTVRYLGVEVDDALTIAERVDA